MDYLADQLAADPTLQQKMDAINMQAQQFAAGKKTRTNLNESVNNRWRRLLGFDPIRAST